MLPKSSDDHLSIIPWLTLMLVHNHTFQNKYGQVIIIFQMSSCQVLRNIIIEITNNQNINSINRYDWTIELPYDEFHKPISFEIHYSTILKNYH